MTKSNCNLKSNNMQEIVFRSNDNQALTTSVIVAEKFGKEHSDVLKAIKSLFTTGEKSLFVENQQLAKMFSLTEVEQPMPVGGGVKKLPIYVMNRDGFTLLAMGFTGAKALAFKLEYMNAFNAMEQQIRQSSGVPQSFAQALLLAAKQQEQIEAQQKQLEVQQPKVEFFDAVAESKTAIEMKLIANTPHFKNVGRNKLFCILREQGILNGGNVPYQRYIDCGYFRTIEQKYTVPSGETRINIKTLVYQRGLDYIRKMLKRLGYSSVPSRVIRSILAVMSRRYAIMSRGTSVSHTPVPIQTQRATLIPRPTT